MAGRRQGPGPDAEVSEALGHARRDTDHGGLAARRRRLPSPWATPSTPAGWPATPISGSVAGGTPPHGRPPAAEGKVTIYTPHDGVGLARHRVGSHCQSVACQTRVQRLERCLRRAGTASDAAIVAAQDCAPLAPFPTLLLELGVQPLGQPAERYARLPQCGILVEQLLDHFVTLFESFRQFHGFRVDVGRPTRNARAGHPRIDAQRRLHAPSSSTLGVENDASRQMRRDGRGRDERGSRGVVQITGRSGGAGDRGAASFCSMRSSSADGDTGFTR